MMIFEMTSPLEKHRALDPTIRAPSHDDQKWGNEEM
jgi:hypothetical protein